MVEYATEALKLIKTNENTKNINHYSTGLKSLYNSEVFINSVKEITLEDKDNLDKSVPIVLSRLKSMESKITKELITKIRNKNKELKLDSDVYNLIKSSKNKCTLIYCRGTIIQIAIDIISKNNIKYAWSIHLEPTAKYSKLLICTILQTKVES